MSELISSYEANPANGTVDVRTPYSEFLRGKFQSLGGRWSGARKCYVFPQARLPEIREELGNPNTGIVTVDVPFHQLQDEDREYLVGWYVLCRRDSRDSRVQFFADMVAGSVPPSGGSVKHPDVRASADAMFRLSVPRDFAERHDLLVVDAEEKSAERDRAIGYIRELIHDHGIRPDELFPT